MKQFYVPILKDVHSFIKLISKILGAKLYLKFCDSDTKAM